MSSKEQFKKYTKRLQDSYQKALWAFYCYEWLKEILAPNIVWQENAERNLQTWNRFNNFFTPANEVFRVYFFLELAKLFDAQEQSIQINKLINIATNQRKTLNKKDLINEFKEDDFIKEILKISSKNELEVSDLQKIKKLLKKQESTIKKLKKYRDEYICHNDIQQEKINISRREIVNLFETVKDILNIFTLKIDSSTTDYEHRKDDYKEDIKNIFDYLNRFEKYRMQEIWAGIIKNVDEKTKEEIKKSPEYIKWH